MRVRRHDSEQPVAAFDDERRIGHHDLQAGLRIVPEGDAAIEHQPVAGVPVEVQVHPDLAGPAERDEEQRLLVAVSGTDARLVREIIHLLLFRW